MAYPASSWSPFLHFTARLPIGSTRQCLRCARRAYATGSQSATVLDTEAEPPMLLRLRSDLKDAMKTKNNTRLAVLRGLLAAAATASKTEVPVNTDSRVLVLLKKQAKASQAAAKDFDAANRAELKAKEEAQLAILNGYIDAIPTVSDNEVSRAVTEILSNLKANGRHRHYGNVMRDLTGRNGVYYNSPLNMERVHEIVQEKIAQAEKSWF